MDPKASDHRSAAAREGKGRGRLATAGVWLLRALAAAAVAGVLLALLARTDSARRLTARLVEERLEIAFRRDVEVGEATLAIVPPGVRVRGLVLSDPNGSLKAPLLRIEEVSGSIAPVPLMFGKFVVDAVEIDGVDLRWEAQPPSPERTPPRGRSRLLRRFSLRRLNARRGTISYKGRRAEFTVDVADLDVTAASAPCDEDFCLEGGARAGRFEVGINENRLAGDALSVSFRQSGRMLVIPRFSMSGVGLRAGGHGAWRFGSPGSGLSAAELNAEGEAAQRLLGKFPVTASALEMSATLTVTEGQPAVTGEATMLGLVYPGIATAERATASFTFKERAFAAEMEAFGVASRLGGLETDTPGRVRGRIAISPDRQVETDVRAGPILYRDVLARLDPRLPVTDLLVSTEGTIAWRIGEPASLEGSLALDLSPFEPGRAPVGSDARGEESAVLPAGRDPSRPVARFSGTATLDLGYERLVLRDGVVTAPELAGTVAGEIFPRDRQAHLDVRLDRVDLSPTLRMLERIPAAAVALRETLQGEASGSVCLDIAPGAPRASGLLEGRGLSGLASGREFGPFDATVTWDFSDGRLRLQDLALAGSGWSAEGTLALDTRAEWPLRRADLWLSELPAQPIWSATGLAGIEGGALSGSVVFDLDLRETGGAWGRLELMQRGGRLAGVLLEEMRARGSVREGTLQIESLQAETAAGTLQAKGSYAPDEKRGEITVRSGPLVIARVLEDLGQEDLDAGGTLTFSGSADLAPEGIGFRGGAEASDVTLKAVSLGTLRSDSIRYSSGPDGELSLDIEAPDLPASGSLRLPSAGERRLEIDLDLPDLDLERLRPLLPPGRLTGLKGRLAGSLKGTVPVGAAGQPDLTARLDRLVLEAADLTLTNAEPVIVRIHEGQLWFGGTRFSGPGTDLSLSGAYDMGTLQAGAGSLSGRFDTRLLNLVIPGIETAGVAEIEIHATASEGDLAYRGRLNTTGTRIDHPGSPSPLENLNLTAVVSREGILKVHDLSFDFAGGKVTGEGGGRLRGIELVDLEVLFKGTAMHAEPFPDLRIFFDGEATFSAEGTSGRLSGRLDVLRAIYTREFGLEGATGFGGARVTPPRVPIRDAGPSLGLDIEIVAPEEVWVRNRSASVEGSARLRVTGTFSRPELTGRVTLFEGGSFQFRDVTYRSEGGGIDFDDPDVIDPLLDLRAATQVGDYDITLHVLGRYSKPRFELTSEPALPQRDIVALLVTGDLYGESMGPEASASFLAEQQVTTYLTAPLSETLGRTVGRALGLTTVQIEPQFVNGRADPTARLTLTKRVSPELLFVYSNNLGANQAEIYQFVYDVSRSWQFIGTRDLDSSYSGDIRFRHRWGGPPRTRPAEGAGSPSETRGLRIAEVRVNGSPFEDDDDPLAEKTKVRVGRKFDRADALEGRERLRRYLARQGYPMASIDLTESPAASPADEQAERGVALQYEIDPGEHVILKVEGAGRPRPLRKTVRSAWERHVLPGELALAGQEALREHFDASGYAAAEIDAETKTRPGRVRVTYQIDQGPKVSIRAIRFDGLSALGEEEIRRVMQTTEDRWNTSGKLKRPLLDADLQAIRSLYMSRGYLDVKVGTPGIDISEDRQEASIAIPIEEGEVWRLGEVEIEGPVTYPAESLREATLLQEGAILRPLQVEQARERLEDLLDANGYNEARVRTRLEGPPGEARAIFSVEEGPRQTVNKVMVNGLDFTGERVVRREIPLAPGDPISRTGLLEIQRELYALGIFRAVDVRTVSAPDDPSRADVLVDLIEGDPLLTAVGLGWDTTERLQAFAQIGHNNAFGTGRSVSFLHRRSSINKRAQVSLSDRRLFGIPFEGIVSAFYDKFQRESFQERHRGVGVQFMHKPNPEMTLLGRYGLEDVRVSDVEIQKDTDLTVEEIRLGSVGGSIARDTRDDILSPTRGRFASVDYRLYAKALGSEAQFNRLFLSTATFHSVKPNLVFGASARIGFAPPFGGTGIVPLSQRFFAGGDTTLRGFQADEAGPVQFPADPNDDDPSYDPIGGQLSVILNGELRFPVWRALRGVVFYDTGNVFTNASEFRFSGSEKIVDDDLGCVIQDGFRHVLGAGLRIDTPLGPIRLEYGRKLDRRRDSFSFVASDCNPDYPASAVEVPRKESPYELFLSVGHAF